MNSQINVVFFNFGPHLERFMIKPITDVILVEIHCHTMDSVSKSLPNSGFYLKKRKKEKGQE